MAIPAKMNDPIQVTISKSVTSTAASINEYLLSFFGSEENIRKFGNYYVLETGTPKFETLPDENNLAFHIRMSTEYRLRFKTKEELENS